eukprot:jgi/Tetstr1/425087/TSEL_015551.t1
MPASAATIVRRWRLVHEAERLGSCRAAAKALGADVRTVVKWVKRAKDTGCVDDLPRSGRPRAPLGTREAEDNLRGGIRAGLKCPQLAQKLKDEVEGLCVTAETGPGFKEWVLFKDEPPTKPSEKNCFKVHVYDGVSKNGITPLFVTVGSTRIKRGKGESKGVTGAVYLDLLKRELIPACKKLMSKRPAFEQNKPWVFQHDNAKPHTTS